MSVDARAAKEIFLAAMELAGRDRTTYVEETCADDETLRAHVEELLRAAEMPDSFLEKAAVLLAGDDTPSAMTEALGDASATPRQADDPNHTRTLSGASVEPEPVLHFLEPPTGPDALGRLLHYQMTEILGKGGFGIVFRAFDEKLHRVVAIKVMAPELAASATARQRFLREARAAAAVRHEHVIDIHVVDHEPIPYLVMEYVAGQTLQEKLSRSGPLELKEILRIGHQIACALGAAHKQGLVHRDIKPANILLENGASRVKVTDFGLARTTDDGSITQPGMVTGTPMYMAPEQAEGLAIDHRADLFSLGSVLYTMCTGRAPFRASTTLGILKRVCEETPRPIRELNPDIPEWLCALVEKLHAKKPEERFPSAKEVEELLAHYLSELQHHGMVRNGPPATASRSVPGVPAPARRRAWRWSVVGAAFLVLAGGVFAILYFLQPPPLETTTIPVAPRTNVINLLALADPARDTVHGQWARTGAGALTSSGETHNKVAQERLELPYHPPEEYDFIIEFTRTAGTEAVTQVVARGDKQVVWTMGGWANRVLGFDSVDGLAASAHPSSVHQAGLVNGKRHQSILKVRKDGITAFLDDQRITYVQTDFTNVALPAGWVLRDPKALGIGSFRSPTIFHRVEVIEVSGRGKPARFPPPPAAVSPFDAKQAQEHQRAWAEHLNLPVEKINSIGMKLRLIPAGEFTMGSTQEEIDKNLAKAPDWNKANVRKEGPQRQVTLDRPYYLGTHEVTVGQFRAFVSDTGYKTWGERTGKGGRTWDSAKREMVLKPGYIWTHPFVAPSEEHPVVLVHQEDVDAFCAWLTKKEGRSYGLPLEEQWEFACRAGSVTPWFWGADAGRAHLYGWFGDSSTLSRQMAVGQKLPNAFGLFDLAGNVAEMTLDAKGALVMRGGHAGYHPGLTRSAAREYENHSDPTYRTGFRVMCEP